MFLPGKSVTFLPILRTNLSTWCSPNRSQPGRSATTTMPLSARGKSRIYASWLKRIGCHAILFPSERIWIPRWLPSWRRSYYPCIKTPKDSGYCKEPIGRQSSTSFREGRRRCANACWIPFTLLRKSRSRINSDRPKAWARLMRAFLLAKNGTITGRPNLDLLPGAGRNNGGSWVKIAPLLGWVILALVIGLTPRTAPAQETMRVAIPLFPTVAFPLLVASDKGFFQKEGLIVEPIRINSAPTTYQSTDFRRCSCGCRRAHGPATKSFARSGDYHRR